MKPCHKIDREAETIMLDWPDRQTDEVTIV